VDKALYKKKRKIFVSNSCKKANALLGLLLLLH